MATPELNDRRLPLVIGLIGTVVTVIAAKGNLPGLGNDATSYVAIADRLVEKGQLGYFLEPKLALWPPGWPSTLAFFEWAFGIRPQIAALIINSLTVIGIAFAANWLIRRMTDDRRLITAATAIAVLGPATTSQSYMVQTETTFVALVLATCICAIRFSDTRSFKWLGIAAVCQWAAFMDRYVGIVSIGAVALWLLIERNEPRAVLRWRNAVGFGAAASLVPGAWLIRNIVVTGSLASAFGPRDTPTATYRTNTMDAATSVGQFIHGVSKYEPFYGVLRLASLALAGVVGLIAIALVRRAQRARTVNQLAPYRVRDLIGSPAGLLLIYAAAHWAYMIYSASTIAFDPVNTRYLAPIFIPALIAGLALLARGGLPRPGVPSDRFSAFLSVALLVLLFVQLAVGLGRASASYWDDRALGYAAPQWRRTQESRVFQSLPSDCERLYSNFPEATYLVRPDRVEAQRSPRITKFASSDRMRELEDAQQAVKAGKKSCLIWVSDRVLATPTYQYQLADLRKAFDLQVIDQDADVAIYLMKSAR